MTSGGMSVVVDSEYEFPHALLVQPSALICVSGLDIVNNNSHKTIWDALSNSRSQERLPVHFRLIPLGHEFPRPKTKRAQYEMHIPKGILKREWMKKHLNEVPSVVAVFYDLDWDDPHWAEKKNDCAMKLQAMRRSLEGRASRVCVVLIQRSFALPSGEDLLAADRASALYHAAELTNKSLFILPYTDNLYGFTARLEKAFFELASGYYQHEIKGVKLHREHLNKKTHQYLFVRHQFKIGFFSELKQDLLVAHNHYSEAYSQLLEVRVSDTNEFEVKTVAGFIVYKVCRLNFLLERARESVSQLKAHIEHYRHQSGPPPLLFQHHAWLSKQLAMFAQLFDETLSGRCGPAVQSQHPGYYYQLAARHALERRTIAAHLCPVATVYPSPDPLIGYEKLEYFGQKPWRPCRLSAEPLDPDKERQGYIAIQWIENNRVDHSAIIVSLLGNAISQFKTYRCPRMRRHLVVQMAEEYQTSKDYGKALTLLCHMVWDYRGEGWWTIVDYVLGRAVTAAYLTASLIEYAALTYEIASRNPTNTQPFYNLIAVTKGKLPKPVPGLTDEEIKEAVELWHQQSESETLTIDTSTLTSALDIKTTLTTTTYDLVHVDILIKSDFEITVDLSSLVVTTSGGSGSTERIVANNISLEKGIHKYQLEFTPNKLDVGKPIQISSVVMKLGVKEGKGRCIHLKFTGRGSKANNFHPELIHFKRTSKEEGELRERASVVNRTVGKRCARMEVLVEGDGPALGPELLPLTVTITCLEDEPATSVILTISLPHHSNLEQNTEFRIEDGTESVYSPVTVNLGTISSGKKLVKLLLVRCNTLQPRHLHFKVSYDVGGERCTKESSLLIDVVAPFEWSSECFNMKFINASSGGLDTHTPFILHTKLTSLSPYPIAITSTHFQLNSNFEFEGEYECMIKGTVLNKGESAVVAVQLSTKVPSETPLYPATLIVCWNRLGGIGSETRAVVGEVTKVVESLVKIEAGNQTQHPTLRSLMPLTYTITNLTQKLFTVQLVMDTSEAFMFSGHKQAVVHILPEEKRRLKYNLYPLVCGWVSLPRLSLTSSVDSLPQSALTRALEALPTSVYVLPLKKQPATNGNVTETIEAKA